MAKSCGQGLRADAAFDHLWREAWAQRASLLLAIASVATGVALALAIHLVNQSALSEFARAMAVVNGQAQAQIVAARGEDFDEQIFFRLLTDPHLNALIETASPIIEFRAELKRLEGSASVPVRLLGLDPFRSTRVTPGLLMQPDPKLDQRSGTDSPLFAADSLFVSPALSARLGVSAGETVQVGAAGRTVAFRIVGILPGAQPHQELAATDIGTLQWRLNWLGRLTRVDIIWASDVDAESARSTLLQALGSSVSIQGPDQALQRSSNLSRAYRINLGVLSLVASFTGAFLVWSTLSTAAFKQQRNLALLGMIGFSRRSLSRALLFAGMSIGLTGALIGAVLGIALARLLLDTVGADLGGGYFSGHGLALEVGLLPVLGSVLLGLTAAIAGAWFPAREVAALSWVQALRGHRPSASRIRRSGPLALSALGLVLLGLPPISGVPLAAYLAIACWLLAGVLLTPIWIRLAGRLLVRFERFWARWPLVWLAVTRQESDLIDIRSAARTAAAVVASFALACAMAIMVFSFRSSVSDWLGRVLPADWYARASETSGRGGIDDAAQRRIQSWPGVARAQFVRSSRLNLNPALPELSVLARPLANAGSGGQSGDGTASIARLLPITGELRPPPADTLALYASEAAAALHGWRVGDEITLRPLHPTQRFFVAGLWRDYARQTGAVIIDLEAYRHLTGDTSINEVSLWLSDGANADALLRLAVADPDARIASLTWRSAEELRRLSLRIFDRSFALTYVLEAVAILIALIGVTAGFSAQALARVREFSMTRFLGVSRRALLAQLGVEALIVLTISVLWGAVLGSAIAGVLVWRVNPQSFHWTMDMRWPIEELATVGLILTALGTVTALLSVAKATRPELTQTLKADW